MCAQLTKSTIRDGHKNAILIPPPLKITEIGRIGNTSNNQSFYFNGLTSGTLGFFSRQAMKSSACAHKATIQGEIHNV